MTSVARLKEEWMEMPASCFETLNFGELQIGQKFICLPCPGDNHGHGGFRNAHHLFIKTENNIKGFGIPTGEAINTKHGTKSSMPHSMYVLLVE